jgi:tRNA threonylcarbamoyladenosine biosynthesis protein TsaE
MSNTFQCSLKDLKDTHRLGTILSTLLKPGHVVGLQGPIGAGKTTLVKSIARGLGVQEEVQSPTFNLFRMHTTGRIPLWHFDCYRLEGHLADLGFDEYLEEDAIAVIEWPEFFPGQLPKRMIAITMTVEANDQRLMTISTDDQAWLLQFRKLWI